MAHELVAIRDKTTKYAVRFSVREGPVTGSLYMPKADAEGVDSLNVSVAPVKA